MTAVNEDQASPLDDNDREARTIHTLNSSEGPVEALRRIARHEPQAVVSVVTHWMHEELLQTD